MIAMIDFKREIALAVEKAVPELKLEEALRFLEQPPDRKLGDFALPCFKFSPLLKKSPQEIALELEKKILLPKSVERMQAVGGFLNFFLKQEVMISETLGNVLKEGKNFGKARAGKAKKVMVEFVSPNTNKPLHVGHLRNAFLGESVCRMFEAQGFRPVRSILVNDRGVHICKSMLAYSKWGKGLTPKKAGKKPDHFVGDYYVMFSQKAASEPKLEEEALELLNKWEKGSKSVMQVWKKMNSWALEGFESTFKKIGIRFDKEYFESKIYKGGKQIVLSGLKKKVFEKDDTGAVIARLQAHGLTDKVLLRADGSSIYITQDIFLAKKKFEDFRLEESLYVVGNEQDLHFRQLFKVLEMLDFAFAKKCRHLSHGLVFLPEGKMKSREGKVVDADDLIASLEELASLELQKRYPSIEKKELEKRKSAISLSALKFFLLKIEAQRDFTFNPEESISFEGETGPYLLYTVARAKSILRKAPKSLLSGKHDLSLLVKEREKEIASLLSKFPESLQQALRNYSPHILCHFLISLSSAFNSYYHETQVLGAETPETAKARLALVKAVEIVLENALDVLGIKVLEEM